MLFVLADASVVHGPRLELVSGDRVQCETMGRQT